MYIENKGHCGENKPGGFNFQPLYSGHPYLCVIQAVWVFVGLHMQSTL